MHSIILLGLVSFFTDVSSEMLYPLIPLFLTAQLGATPAIVGIIEGIAESLSSLLKVFSGYWSDKTVKRKPLALGGYSLSGLGKIFILFATAWPLVFWGRILDRFGKGIRTAPRDALIAEACPEGKYGAGFGLHRAMDTMGAVIGVLIAYIILSHQTENYRQVFLFALIPAFIGVMVLFLVKEKKNRCDYVVKKFSLASWRDLESKIKGFYVIIFLFALGNSSNHFLLLRAYDYGFNSQTVLLLYLVYNTVYALSSYPAGRLSDFIGRRTVLVAGYLFYGLIYLGFAFAAKSAYFWYLFGAYGFYAAFTEGVEKAFIAEIAPKDQRATFLGLHATLVGIGLLPASILAGFFWTAFGPQAPFFLGAALGLTAALGLAIILKPRNDIK